MGQEIDVHASLTVREGERGGKGRWTTPSTKRHTHTPRGERGPWRANNGRGMSTRAGPQFTFSSIRFCQTPLHFNPRRRKRENVGFRPLRVCVPVEVWRSPCGLLPKRDHCVRPASFGRVAHQPPTRPCKTPPPPPFSSAHLGEQRICDASLLAHWEESPSVQISSL